MCVHACVNLALLAKTWQQFFLINVFFLSFFPLDEKEPESKSIPVWSFNYWQYSGGIKIIGEIIEYMMMVLCKYKIYHEIRTLSLIFLIKYKFSPSCIIGFWHFLKAVSFQPKINRKEKNYIEMRYFFCFVWNFIKVICVNFEMNDAKFKSKKRTSLFWISKAEQCMIWNH